jgi:hypothetical protein
MAAGCSIETASKACTNDPAKHGTHGTHLIKALTTLNIKCSPKSIINKTRTCPVPYAICRLKLPKNKTLDGHWWGGHWVLWWNTIIYDPAPKSKPGMINLDYPGIRVTSYIQLFPKNP